jgi:hypothetical protein
LVVSVFIFPYFLYYIIPVVKLLIKLISQYEILPYPSRNNHIIKPSKFEQYQIRRMSVVSSAPPSLTQPGHEALDITRTLAPGLIGLQTKIPRQISISQQGTFAGGNFHFYLHFCLHFYVHFSFFVSFIIRINLL